MFSKNKKMLIATAIVSIFAVFVTSVSTLAWFKVNEVTVDSVDNPSLVKSDSSNLVVNNITGYKFKYNDVSFGVTDYEHGEPVSYTATDIQNVDQSDRKELDYPTKGEGFYIVGNNSWVTDYNYATGESKTVDSVWTYDSGLRLDDDNIEGNNNKATYHNIYLTAGTEFRIRKHTLTVVGDQVQTESYSDSWFSVGLANTSQTTTAAQMNGDNIKIKAGRSGYYNIYLTNDNNIAFYPISIGPKSMKVATDLGGGSVSSNSDKGLTVSEPEYTTKEVVKGPKKQVSVNSSKGVYYLKPNSNWKQNSPKFGLYYYGSGSAGWVTMTETSSGSGIYEANVTVNHTTIVFARINPSYSIPLNSNWDGKWNQSDDLTASNYVNKVCTISGWDKQQSATDAVSLHYTTDGTNWYRKFKGENTSSDYSESLSLTTSSVFIYVVSNSWKRYSDLADTSKPYCKSVGTDGNAGVQVAGTYTVGWNGSKQYVNNSAAIIGYGTDASGASWSYQALSSNLSLSANQAFKVIYEGVWYNYTNLDNNGKTLFVQGSYDNNIKALLKGTYKITFNTSTHVISFTVNSSSFNDTLSGSTTKTYYLSYSGASTWGDSTPNVAVIAYDSTGKSKLFTMSSVSGVSGFYKATVTGTHTGVYFIRYGNSGGTWTVWNRTVAVSNPNNTALNWYNLDTIDGTPSVYSGSGGWNTFYEVPSSSGYYLVGDSNFEKNASGTSTGITPWTFNNANKCSTSSLPFDVVAKYENRYLKAGMQFQIWYFTSGTGRTNMWADYNDDDETDAAINKTDGNLVVETGVSGYFDIYVTSTNKVMVKDRNDGSRLYVSYSSTTNNYEMGKTPDGSSFKAVYEQGIQVTSAMATAGTYIGVVNEFAGFKTGYGTVASSYSFVSGSGSKTFDGKTFTCLKIVKPGFYNFYLNSSGQIMISSLPYLVDGSDVKTDGGDDGYYIIPYTSSVGNGSYRNGLKMNVINGESATTAEGNKNIADYSRYRAAANEQFIIKYFANNMTHYSPTEIATDDTTKACLEYVGDGVYKFKSAGIYNIYMYKTSTGRAISVAKDSLSDFSRLNSIPGNATTSTLVKNANTTLILDVTFILTTSVNMTISLDRITTNNTNVSKYISYALFVDTNYSSGSGTTDTQKIYNYFRGSTPYGSLKAMSSYSSLTASGTFGAGTHHAYIVIDYNPSQVANMPTGVPNNFYFILNATQA